MVEIFQRAIDNLLGRIDGPMAIRLAVQPIIASAFALRDGVRDVRQHQPPYGLSLFETPDAADFGLERAGNRFEPCFVWRFLQMLFINYCNWVGSISARR